MTYIDYRLVGLLREKTTVGPFLTRVLSTRLTLRDPVLLGFVDGRTLFPWVRQYKETVSNRMVGFTRTNLKKRDESRKTYHCGSNRGFHGTTKMSEHRAQDLNVNKRRSVPSSSLPLSRPSRPYPLLLSSLLRPSVYFFSLSPHLLNPSTGSIVRRGINVHRYL